MRACNCARQLWAGSCRRRVILPAACIDRVIHHHQAPTSHPSLPLLSPYPITVQEPHEPKPVLQGPPKRHQEAQELRLQVPQGGKCLHACLPVNFYFFWVGDFLCSALSSSSFLCLLAAFRGVTYAYACCAPAAADGVTCAASPPSSDSDTINHKKRDEGRHRPQHLLQQLTRRSS